MSYRIVAKGPDKECLTLAQDTINLQAKIHSLKLDGYTDFEIEGGEDWVK